MHGLAWLIGSGSVFKQSLCIPCHFSKHLYECPKLNGLARADLERNEAKCTLGVLILKNQINCANDIIDMDKIPLLLARAKPKNRNVLQKGVDNPSDEISSWNLRSIEMFEFEINDSYNCLPSS